VDLGGLHEGCELKPQLKRTGDGQVTASHVSLGTFHLTAGPAPDGRAPELLFTDNETNAAALFGVDNRSRYVKDALDRYLVHGEVGAVNPEQTGTKVAAWYPLDIPAGEQVTVPLRLYADDEAPRDPVGPGFKATFTRRIHEADAFYRGRIPAGLPAENVNIIRQAYAGLLWSKQFYHYVLEDWLAGDPLEPPPPPQRKDGRNRDWVHLFNRDVLSMPDKWEYPWYAAWDLAFHMLPLARIDPALAKSQLTLLLREWYMHPNGQIPAYEFNFCDVNPPVHAWACWRVYKITGPPGARDRRFLASAFQKLLMNFTWWVNRKDLTGKHIFSGGFLGLDNIGVFDRSTPLPAGGHLEQADGTAWMAFYCATMLAMALELARDDPVYEDLASKFFEHFVAIADATNTLGGTGLWDEQDGFYYDQMRLGDRTVPLRVRSLVGLLPLIAVDVLDEFALEPLGGFRRRMDWFLDNRRDLARQISYMDVRQAEGEDHLHRLLAIPSRQRLRRVLGYMLDEDEFLSPYGVRSLSRHHLEHPYVLHVDGQQHCVGYAPAESDSGLFGGNSNWRGPVWMPINYLLVEALERYHHFYGDSFQVACPTGSGQMMNLGQVAREIARRLYRLFMPNETGHRPCHRGLCEFAEDPYWRDLTLFHEYFDAETGRGCGASHQTGWTALIVRFLEDVGKTDPARAITAPRRGSARRCGR